MKRAADSDEPQQAQKRFKSDFLDITTVLVGETEERFIVHTANICAKSPFFEAACSKKWKEGQEKLVRLPEVKPRIFKIYVNWVYSGAIDIDVVDHPPTEYCQSRHTHTDQTRCSIDSCRKTKRAHAYSALYVVADMFLDTRLKIFIIDLLKTSEGESSYLIICSTTNYLWAQAPSGCGLQRLALDIWTTQLSLHVAKQAWPAYSLQFKADLAMRLMEVKDKPREDYDPGNMARCYYHDHEDGTQCD